MHQVHVCLRDRLLASWHTKVEALFSLSSHKGALLSLGVFALVAFADFATPPDLNLTFAYVFVVVIAAWNVNFPFALGLVFATFAIQLAMLSGLKEAFSAPFFFYVSLGNRLFTLLLAAALITPLKRMYSREKAVARLDILTGLPNRQAFREFLIAEIERRNRDGFPFSAAYVDADNFKAVNDRSGHHQGDKALTEIGHCVRNTIRKTDLVARLGGDEFAILFHHSDLAVAQRIIGRVRKNVNERMAAHHWPITLSIGLATFDADGLTPDAVMSYCDGLMYEAKRCGKDSIVCRNHVTPGAVPEKVAARLGAR